MYFLAPGAYCPEKVNFNKGPEFSLSGKHILEKPTNVPGKRNSLDRTCSNFA